MEEELIDVPVMGSFAGIDLLGKSVLDESTIMAFRRLLEEKNLAEVVLRKVNEHLEEKGCLTRQGAVVDAIVIQAPGSTKNKER